MDKIVNFNIENLRHNLGSYIIPEKTKNGIAVDIGCNNGSFLNNNLLFFKKIYAYEPNINLYKLLKNRYGKYNHIEINNKCLSDTDDKCLKLVHHNFTTDDGSFAIYNADRKDIWDESNLICDAYSISIDTILNNVGGFIDYLKIDCECGEYEGLLNKNLKNISYIGIEMHHQLGETKYKELYDYISLTHNSNKDLNYISGDNQEYLFTNKLI